MFLVCKFRIEAFLLYLNELIFDYKFCIQTFLFFLSFQQFSLGFQINVNLLVFLRQHLVNVLLKQVTNLRRQLSIQLVDFI